ncbi:WNT8B protein, partial [Polyodon spathula]|nr:WNT8B protein [Polyodon spathula]
MAGTFRGTFVSTATDLNWYRQSSQIRRKFLNECPKQIKKGYNHYSSGSWSLDALLIISISLWSVNNFLMTGPKAYLIYSSSVAAGAQSGIEECKYQFTWDRWNCPERALQLSTHSGLRSGFIKSGQQSSTFHLYYILEIPTRDERIIQSPRQCDFETRKTGPAWVSIQETAFVHAISSAGVMYTLTRNCSLGDFDNCGCDETRNGQLGGQGWLWGGCSDNVGFGEVISKQFVDALETGQDARAAMNLHNNEAGRKAVKGTMKKTCKCHGVSGSCTTQTCWLQLPEFREVGNYLKEKYHKALKVDLLKGAGNSAASRGAIAETFSTISKKELVHLEDSPDYCLENKTLGLQGTEGRECIKKGKNLSKWEKRSCKRLCGECGLAVEERKADLVSSCNCKFHWCCAVKCEQCRKTITKYFCVKERRGTNESTSRRKKLRLKKAQ